MRVYQKIFIACLFAISLVCTTYYFLCGFYAGFGMSILWVWIAAGIGFFVCGIMALVLLKYSTSHSGKSRIILRLCSAPLVMFTLVFMVFELFVILGFSREPTDDLDYIIVMGALTDDGEPSPALKSRINAAYEYLNENPRTIAIASGGIGEGEVVSEAKCIEDELLSYGIDKSRIIIEDKSGTTAENIKNSYMISGDSSVGIVTNGFHIFRSILTAQSNGYTDVCGIPTKYDGLLLPHYMLREFATFTVDTIHGNIKLFSLNVG